MKTFKQFLNESKIKFIINKDLSVDALGEVRISGVNLTKILVKFNNINGGFYCKDNKLTSLEGAPKTVGEYFDCNSNSVKFTIDQVKAVSDIKGDIYV